MWDSRKEICPEKRSSISDFSFDTNRPDANFKNTAFLLLLLLPLLFFYLQILPFYEIEKFYFLNLRMSDSDSSSNSDSETEQNKPSVESDDSDKEESSQVTKIKEEKDSDR